MEFNHLFSGTIPTLARLLDLRSLRHNAIVSNIANVDTPDYKAFHVHVEKAMRQTSDGANRLALEQTHPVHLEAREASIISTRNLRSRDASMSTRGDGNTVDIDRAMSDMAENSIIYNAATQLVKKKFDGLMLAITGGK